MSYFTDLDQVCQYAQDLLTANKASFTPTVKTVEFANDDPVGWPAIVILAGNLERHPQASGGQVELEFTVIIYVMHAPLTMNFAARTKQDLQLAAQVRNLLHANYALPTVGGSKQAAGSWVMSERPRVVPSAKAPQVVSTELIWTVRSRGNLFS